MKCSREMRSDDDDENLFGVRGRGYISLSPTASPSPKNPR
jgi:hypothetical protein